MHELYELKSMLCRELEEYGKKGELTAGALDVVDKLAHTVKNLSRIIEEMEDGYSGDDGSYRARSYRGQSRDYRDGSYARGRMNARSTGRYSRDGLADELRDLMDQAPEHTKAEFQRLIEKIER